MIGVLACIMYYAYVHCRCIWICIHTLVMH